MGKRKRHSGNSKAPVPIPDHVAKLSQMDVLSEEKSCNEVENNPSAPSSSIVELTGDPPQHSKLPEKHKYFSRAMLLRNPHYCGRKYSLRNSSRNADASTSHGKGIASPDDKMNLKISNQCHSNDSGLQIGVEDVSRLLGVSDKASHRQERIRSTLFSTNAVSPDVHRVVCGLCDRSLRRKSIIFGNTIASEPSVVAVLVCGHLYHADCLEQRTSPEERMDPSCPTCKG